MSTTPAWQTNTAFKPGTKLQLAWDSTSIGALKTCPRYYEYTIVEGWTPRSLSVHLAFGQYYHSALEVYDHARSAGKSHAEATIAAVRRALSDTWTNGRPWSSDDKNKNRFTLVRTVVWYLEHFAEDPMETVQLANGKPAVELSFRFDPGIRTSAGDAITLCGHMDRLASMASSIFVMDRKTTKSTLGQDFFQGFCPDNQFTLYTLAGKIVYGIPVQGVIVDGAQVAVTFSRFLRGPSLRSDAFLEEWLKELAFWLRMAEYYAGEDHWPMNDKACGNYGGCAFREICAKAPGVRKEWLERSYKRRVWDPLQVRGDI